MSRNRKHRKILSGCFAVSLLFHAAALLFFERYSFWFSSSQKVGEQTGWLSLVDKKERDQILKTSFESLLSEESEKEIPPKPQQEMIPFVLRSSLHLPEPENSILFQNSLSFQTHDLLIAKQILPIFLIPSESLNLLDHLPKDLVVPIPSRQGASHLLPLPTSSTMAVSIAPPSLQQEAPASPIIYPELSDLPLSDAPQTAKAPSMIPISNLPRLPTLAELDTSSYSDSFDADLTFLPKEEGSGYIFALTLIPRPDLELPKIRQHFTFLIDRSNSIQQGRLTVTKSAIHKAFEELRPEDTFNIIAFDSKLEKMSPNPLPCIGPSFAIAEEFLEKIQLGSFFSSGDLYKPLLLTVPSQVQNDEIHTAILLTDAETFAKKTTQRAILHDWTRYNGGKVTLYAVGINSDAHLATLDVAAAFNKGKLSNAPTNRGIKRKLLKLLKSIQNPIAKNLACSAISRSPQSKVRLFPQGSRMPHLYLDQPYVILGETDTLDDFILFVQGRLKDRWLNIKKTISFINARKGNKSLKQEWAFQRAYTLYEQYIADDNPKYIAEVRAILEPFDFQVAFQ